MPGGQQQSASSPRGAVGGLPGADVGQQQQQQQIGGGNGNGNQQQIGGQQQTGGQKMQSSLNAVPSSPADVGGQKSQWSPSAGDAATMGAGAPAGAAQKLRGVPNAMSTANAP